MAGIASPSTLRFDAPIGVHPRPSVVRLTRRGRGVVLLALVTLLLLAFTLGRTGDSQASTDSTPKALYVATTVQQGETLLAVAQRVAPGRDPRAVIAQIRELNHLDSAAVQAGQQLLLPRAA